MSSRRTRRRRVVEEEEDDRVEVIAVEDGTTSGDQGQHDSEQGLKIAEKYNSEAKKELEKLGSKRPSQQEINKLVSETMRFVMFKTHQSESAPIKHEDLVKVVQNNGYQVRGLPGAIISLAQERFARTFDLDLREVKRLAKKRQTGKSLEPTTTISGTYYILVSLLSDDMRRRFMKREDVRMERAFTMVVLSLIYAANEPVPEDVLFNQLTDLGMFPTSTQAKPEDIHPTLGFSPRFMLTKLCQQRYISKEKHDVNGGGGGGVQQHGQQLFTYDLAEGYENEIGEDVVRNFVAGMMRDV